MTRASELRAHATLSERKCSLQKIYESAANFQNSLPKFLLCTFFAVIKYLLGFVFKLYSVFGNLSEIPVSDLRSLWRKDV